MKQCTEAEKAFLDASFSLDKKAATAVMEARLAVLKERLPQKLLDQAIQIRLDYLKARETDSAMWDRLAALGFVGDFPGGRLWKQIDEAAKARMGGVTYNMNHIHDDIMRAP